MINIQPSQKIFIKTLATNETGKGHNLCTAVTCRSNCT